MSTTTAASALDPRIADFLAERHGAGAADVEVRALSGDASTRRYFRLRAPQGGAVLSLYPEPFDVNNSPFRVVRDLFAGYGIPVPGILDHDGARGILVLQDLGDVTLQEALRGATDAARDAHYREAISRIAQLQGEAARGPQQAPCFSVAFDLEKLAWELHYFEKHFVEGLRGANLSVEDRSVLAEGFHRLASEIASWPRVLTHRDFHSRNLMLHEGGQWWIDFQDARMGPATYDLASLLRDAYVELPEELVAELCEEFRQRALPGEARETFARRFELMSVQRNLKALGTFGFMKTQRDLDVYLPYIPHTARCARRNLLRYPELERVHRVLARHVPELA